jgi:CheY-like chemotaxis protein
MTSAAMLAPMTGLAGMATDQPARPTPRGAMHDTVGRVVFDWPRPVKWSQDLTDTQLVLHFDAPVAGDPSVLIKPLSSFIDNVLVSTDKKDVTFRLKMPVTVKEFNTGQSTVFDITPGITPGAAAKASPGPEASAKSAPSDKASPAAKSPKVEVRGGRHEDFYRLVFEWPADVDAEVKRDGNRLDVAFDTPGQINPSALASALPPGVTVQGVKDAPQGLVVSLNLPDDLAEHHSIGRHKVVVDLAKSKTPSAAVAAKEAAPPPPAATPPAAAEPARPPTVEAKPSEAVAAAVSGGSAGENGAPDASAPLVFAFDQPTTAAVFTRAGYWWLVFDRKNDMTADAITETGGKAVTRADVVPTKKGMAIRLLLAEGVQPVPRKDGKNNWRFDLAHRETEGPFISYANDRQFDFQDRGRLVIRVPDANKEEVIIRDPEVGDMIHVVPVGTAGAGNREEIDLPEADVLPSVQGVAMVPRNERAWLDSTHGNIQVSSPGGLTMSKLAATPQAEGHLTPKMEGPGEVSQPVALDPVGIGDPFDPAKWARGGIVKFDADHAAVVARAMQEPAAERSPADLDVARHYIANGFDAEALGVLRGIGVQDPGAIDKANFRAVRGLANLLMKRNAEAIEDFSHSSLAGDKKAPMWLAAAKIANGADPASQVNALRSVADEMKGLAAPLRMALGRPAVLALLATGDTKAAGKVVNAMDGPGTTDAHRAALAYLGGLVAEANHQDDDAIKRYQAAEAGKSREDRALAADRRIELQFKHGTITADEAIHQLKRLPYVWRGGDFEYRTVKRAADLLLASGRYREGFQSMRQIIQNYPDNPDVPNVSKAMGDLFNKLYLDSEADKLPPIQAIGLYNEFQDLTPPGDKGDEMIRKLADRLAADAPDILITDYQMPGCNGLTLARLARRARPGLPIIVVTALRDPAVLEALQKQEVSRVLHKPLSEADLLEAVRPLL